MSFDKKSGAEIHLQHADGVSKMYICQICAGTLQASKEGKLYDTLLANEPDIQFHDPEEI